MTVAVLCAVRGTREAAVVTALEGAGGRVSVTRRCADLAELLGAAAAGLGRVALVSDDLPMLDREALARLRSAGVRVVALVDGGSGAGERMLAMGADTVVASDLPLDELVTTVLAVGDAGDHGDGAVQKGRAEDPRGRPLIVEPAVPQLDEVSPPAARGRMIAVWGPTGAPGRTTLAVNLAAELAALEPGPVAATSGGLLVDADTYGGTVAQVIGLLDESPGIAAAARAAGTGTLDATALARLTPVVEEGLRVLTGISRADRWPELPGSSLDVVWETARALAPWVVVDCGFCLEQDEVLSYDTHAPRRNAATLSALAAADVVVVVGAGDPVGMQRLVRALTDLAELGAAPGADRVVVVNRVRASAAGHRPEVAVREALARYAGVTDACTVPEDRDTVDAALLRGVTLREVSARSPARAAIATLARGLAGVGAPPAGPGRRRSARSAARA